MKIEKETAIVRTMEQEQRSKEKSFEDMYNQLREKAYQKEIASLPSKDHRLSSYGKFNLLFPLLDENGIDTWQKLDAEANLIDEKKSYRSSKVRQAVIELHTLCLINKIQEDENNTPSTGLTDV